MNAINRWNLVAALFGELVDKAPAERMVILDSRCGDDDSLRADVEDMLAAHESAELEGMTNMFGEDIDRLPTTISKEYIAYRKKLDLITIHIEEELRKRFGEHSAGGLENLTKLTTHPEAQRFLSIALGTRHGSPDERRSAAAQDETSVTCLANTQREQVQEESGENRTFRASPPCLRPGSHATAESLLGRGLHALETGNPDIAIMLLGEALVIRQTKYPKNHHLIGEIESAMGAYYTTREAYDKAQKMLASAKEKIVGSLGGQHELTLGVLRRIEDLNEARRRRNEATE